MKVALSWLSNNKAWLFGGLGTTILGSVFAYILSHPDTERANSATVSVERFEDLIITDAAVRNLFEAMGEAPPEPEELDSRLRAFAALVISLSSETAGEPGAPPSSSGDKTPSVSLQFPFEFDSAQLTAEARVQLDYLADALQSDVLRQYRFAVVGHTDAVGSEGYNRALSERQAEAIRRYLIEQHGIDPTRLLSEGRGESQLLDPEHPASPVNRRIEVINLGS